MWSHELLLTGKRDINSYVTLSVTFASDHSQNLTIHDHCPLRWFVHPFPSWMGTGRNASLSKWFLHKDPEISKNHCFIFPLTHSHSQTYTVTHSHTLFMSYFPSASGSTIPDQVFSRVSVKDTCSSRNACPNTGKSPQIPFSLRPQRLELTSSAETPSLHQD